MLFLKIQISKALTNLLSELGGLLERLVGHLETIHMSVAIPLIWPLDTIRWRVTDLLLVKQRHLSHYLHAQPDFPWPYINSGDLLSLKVEPALTLELGISTQFSHSEPWTKPLSHLFPF